MGNSQPKNSTGRKATEQKLDHAKKLGVLSLSEHGLTELPAVLVSDPGFAKLRTLDLSRNALSRVSLPPTFRELKFLNLEHNGLSAGTLGALSQFTKLQTLSLAHNRLGLLPDNNNNTTTTTRKLKATSSTASSKAVPATDPALLLPPGLPPSLRQINLSGNQLGVLPAAILSSALVHLEKLDLSHNPLQLLDPNIAAVPQLQELRLDNCGLTALPDTVGDLTKLKVLSAEDNQLRADNDNNRHAKSLPTRLFTDTALIDLNLRGNPMTNTQLNQLDGFADFLDRRQKVKSKTMTNLETLCGLE